MSPEGSQSAFEAYVRACPGRNSPVWTARAAVTSFAYSDCTTEQAWRTWCAALEWVESQKQESQR